MADAVRRWKAERQLSVGAPLAGVRVSCPAGLAATLADAAGDLRSVTRAQRVDLVPERDGFGVAVQHIVHDGHDA